MAQNDKIPEVIGLVPAAGDGTRLGALPCSKEVYPIGLRKDIRDGATKVKVAMHFILEKMKCAGITTVFIILNKNKWDIPKYFKDGGMVGVNLSYLVMDSSQGVPFTLDQAYPFVKDADIALGLPDILFRSDDPYSRLLQRRRQTKADIVLGCFPVENTDKFDMVEIDSNGRVRDFVIKPSMTELKFSWIIAIWSPNFTTFMNTYLLNRKLSKLDGSEGNEIYLGHVFKAAMERDFIIESVVFPDCSCRDIGTTGDLMKAIYEFNTDFGDTVFI